MGSARLTDSGNLVDVEVYWDADSGDSTTQIYWTIHENEYGRTFCVKAKGGGSQINQGGTVSVGGSYYLQCFREGRWYKDLGPFTITTNSSSGSGGSSTPSYSYATNSISFDKTKYEFGSSGGIVDYSRATTGTGNAPVLYINSKKAGTLGSRIYSGESVNESFSTTDYADNFGVGSYTVELKVSEHSGTSVITPAVSDSATVVIYARPNKPEVKQVIVSSSAAGSYLSTPTYDNTSLLYVSDNGTNYEPYSSSIFFKKGQTYYFKATHKITSEDSEILIIVPVVSNTAQKISFDDVKFIEETSNNLLSTKIAYARKVTPTVTTDAQSYLWYFRSSETYDGLENSEAQLITTSTEKTVELTINDSILKRGYYYRIGVSGVDNYGDISEINWYAKTFQIAHEPEISQIKNYFVSDTSFDINLAKSNRFYTNLTLYFSYDSEITQDNVYCEYREKSASTLNWSKAQPEKEKVFLGSINENGYIMVQLPSTLASDKEYQFRLCFTFLNTEIYTNTIEGMYQINKNNIVSNLSIYGNQKTFKPYTEIGVLELRMAKPYEQSFQENYTSYDKFQCQIVINKKTILLDMLETDGFKENSNDTVSFFFNKSNLYDKLKTLNLDQTLSYNATLKLAVDNVFGISHSKSLAITIDYKEKPIVTFNQPKYNNDTLLNSSSIIKENDEITFSFSFSDYNKETFRSCIQINRSDSTTPNGQWIDYTQEGSHLSSGTESGYLTPIEYKSTKTITIKEITLPKYIFFRVRITDSSGNIYSNYYNCGRSLQHTAPVIQQLNVTYKEEGDKVRSENSIVTGQLALVDLGIGLKDSSSLDLIDSANSALTFQGTFSTDGSGMTEISGISYSFEELIEKFQQNKNLTFTLPFNFEGQDVNYATLQLKARTIINYSANGLYSDKTFELSPFIVFNTLQTVSYRKNRLAINVRDFDTNPDYEEAILVIGQANSSKNKIIYSAPNGSGYLINFIIDGGTWD